MYAKRGQHGESALLRAGQGQGQHAPGAGRVAGFRGAWPVAMNPVVCRSPARPDAAQAMVAARGGRSGRRRPDVPGPTTWHRCPRERRVRRPPGGRGDARSSVSEPTTGRGRRPMPGGGVQDRSPARPRGPAGRAEDADVATIRSSGRGLLRRRIRPAWRTAAAPARIDAAATPHSEPSIMRESRPVNAAPPGLAPGPRGPSTPRSRSTSRPAARRRRPSSTRPRPTRARTPARS